MNPPRDCEAFERMVSDMIAGDLADTLQNELSEHLESCARCRERAVAMYRQDRCLVELASHASTKALKKRISEQLGEQQAIVRQPAERKLRTVRIRRAVRRNNSFLIPAAVAASLLLAAILFVTMQKNQPTRTDTLAELVAFSGGTSVKRQNTALEILNGMQLEAGDVITVPADGKATVTFSNKIAQLQLDGASVLRVDPPENGYRAMLESGTLTAQVSPQPPGTTFVIKTPVARTEVIGTQFKLSASTVQTRLDVVQGKVRLIRANDGEKVEVGADDFAIANESGPIQTRLFANAPPAIAQRTKPEQIKKVVSVDEQKQLHAIALSHEKTIQDVLKEFATKVYRDAKGAVPYRLFTPKVTDNAKVPLIIYLHGYGARGSDNIKQLTDQPQPVAIWALPENQQKHPCFIVAPQSAGTWENNASLHALDMIDDVIKTQPIDTKRIYVIGLSSGGNGVFWMLQHRPRFFAAAISISGWITDPAKAKSFAHVPVWLFHGSADTTVKVDTSRNAFKVLCDFNVNGDVRFYEYDKAAHNIFADVPWTSDLLDWTFARAND